MAYKPFTPFNVAMELLTPVYTNVKGTRTKVYPESGEAFFGSFRTFVGYDRSSNDLETVSRTATVDTWYRPDIKADCRVLVKETGDVFEIIGDPEDIEMRHQYMKFQMTKVGG